MAGSLGVLITYYNEGELLTQCLRSLVSQEGAPEEIWIYDDASTTPPEPFLDPAWNVNVLRGEKNRGPSQGRNALLAKVRTDYIHFHDADDWFHPEWCRRVRESFATGTEAIFTEVSSYSQGQLLSPKVLALDEILRGEDLLRFCLLHAMLVPSGTYRRSLVERLKGYRTDMWQSEDYDFHARLAAENPNFQIIPEALVHIRIRPESRSHKQDEVWKYRLKALERLHHELEPAYHASVAEAAAGIGSKLFQIGCRDEARHAFELARVAGAPEFRSQSDAYRHIAKTLGPEAAEWLGVVYRTAVPAPLRKWVRKG